MSQQKMNENWDQQRQVCRDKDFYVASNNSTRDKDQRRKVYRDKRKLCRDRVIKEPKKSCRDIENSIVTEYIR